MLIGGHVSPSGGPAKAIARGVERGCRSIQIFNQSPRAWRPRQYSDDEIAEFRDAMADSPIDALVIHAVYLINSASAKEDIRSKSLTSLIAALRAGKELGALGVVLHPGSALKNGGPVDEAMERAAVTMKEALAESDSCDLYLENTAGAGGTLGRSFEELAKLIELLDDNPRVHACLDSCHLYASGYDIRDAQRLAAVIDQFDAVVGLDRLGCLHLNDSKTGLGSNRDRHANIGDGELGREGCAAFLREPRFNDLPCILEVPGPDGKGPGAADIALANELRECGE